MFLPNPENWIWVNDFLAEAASFPVGPTDDQVDAMSQALSRLRRSTQVGMLPIRANIVRKKKIGTVSF